MTLNEDQKEAISRVLKEEGFTSAWVLENSDESEAVFLVPGAEGDFRSIQESPSTGLVVRALKAALPHRKVFLGAFSEGLRVSRLY
jgi:hypothetical protein